MRCTLDNKMLRYSFIHLCKLLHLQAMESCGETATFSHVHKMAPGVCGESGACAAPHVDKAHNAARGHARAVCTAAGPARGLAGCLCSVT